MSATTTITINMTTVVASIYPSNGSIPRVTTSRTSIEFTHNTMCPLYPIGSSVFVLNLLFV